mmetsp:Transcript_20310/g.56432  ORF Transcript_20310/g.56432 Transcript_20310/m.56432 type:complete len:431 (-) Transcript_20310:134-1426(-)
MPPQCRMARPRPSSRKASAPLSMPGGPVTAGQPPASAPIAATTGVPGVRLVVFDFDQTLSTIHVFKSLAGWGEAFDTEADERAGGGLASSNSRLPRPFASSERGQVRRIAELDQVAPFKDAGGFAMWAFGGATRVSEVRDLLQELRGLGVELLVCTKGFVGAVQRCLRDLSLLEFFSEVYGNIGSSTYGATRYDQTVARTRPTEDEERLLGSEYQAAWATKDKLIGQLMREQHLRKREVVLVEDDPEEIRRGSRVCSTLWVQEARGLTLEQLDRLRSFVSDPAALPTEVPPSSVGASSRRPPLNCNRRQRGASAVGMCSGMSRGSREALHAPHRPRSAASCNSTRTSSKSLAPRRDCGRDGPDDAAAGAFPNSSLASLSRMPSTRFKPRASSTPAAAVPGFPAKPGVAWPAFRREDATERRRPSECHFRT